MRELKEEIERLEGELAELRAKQEGIVKVLETDNVSYTSLRRGAMSFLKFLWSKAKWFALAAFMGGAITEKRYNWISHFLSFFR